jgi:hypothetical protein
MVTATVLVPHSERDVAFDEFDHRVGEAMGLHNCVSASLVAVVAECLAEGWWQDQATNSPEHWCRVRLGVSAATASKLVRCAKRLGEFPRVAAAFEAGQLSLDHVDVIVGLAHPCHDKALAESGPTWDIARMRRIIRHLPRPVEPAPEPEPSAEADDHPRGADDPVDRFAAGWGDDGRFRGSFDLGADAGGLLDKALSVARGALFTARTGVDVADDDREVEPSSVSSLDALQRLLHAALDGLDPNVAAGRRPGDRTQVIVHIDAGDLTTARLHLGPLLPVTVAAQLTCDADFRAVVERHGIVVATFRRRRTVPEVLRNLIEDRDGGCRVPGCGRCGFLHIHHLVHWAKGGPTSADNLVALCPEHHRMVHAGLLRISGNPDHPDGLVFVDARGRPLPQPRALAPPGPLPDPPSHYRGTYRGQRISAM